jgi:hypothetical protein
MQLLTLMHDAAEAYLGDITKPEKTEEQYSIEEQLLYDILTDFDITPPTEYEWDFIREIDSRIIVDECAAVRSHLPCDAPFEPLGIEIYGWEPRKAQEQFLTTFHKVRW